MGHANGRLPVDVDGEIRRRLPAAKCGSSVLLAGNPLVPRQNPCSTDPYAFAPTYSTDYNAADRESPITEDFALAGSPDASRWPLMPDLAGVFTQNYVDLRRVQLVRLRFPPRSVGESTITPFPPPATSRA